MAEQEKKPASSGDSGEAKQPAKEAPVKPPKPVPPDPGRGQAGTRYGRGETLDDKR